MLVTLDGGVVFGRIQLSTDGMAVTETDSFKDTSFSFVQVADLVIESPIRLLASLSGDFNPLRGQTVLAAADLTAISRS